MSNTTFAATAGTLSALLVLLIIAFAVGAFKYVALSKLNEAQALALKKQKSTKPNRPFSVNAENYDAALDVEAMENAIYFSNERNENSNILRAKAPRANPTDNLPEIEYVN